MQLEALLKSIVCYWKHPEYEINVLFRASKEAFLRGYNKLRGVFHSVTFLQETALSGACYSWPELTHFYNLKLLFFCPHLRGHKSDFRQQLLTILNRSKSDTVLFLTDDSIVFRPIEIRQENLLWLTENPIQRQFSLRHGQELSNGRQLSLTEDGYEWRFRDFGNQDHWGYRFSLDGHLYHRDTMASFLKRASFNNPNSLESSGFLHSCHKGIFTEGRCRKNVSLLSYPLNIVQSTFANAHMDATPSVLNDYFLQGYSLQYPIPEKISSFQVYPRQVALVRKHDKIIFPIQLTK